MVPERMKSLSRKGAFLALLLVALSNSFSLVATATAQDHRHSSVTGFFGLDGEGRPIVDRHGIMLVFDGPIAPETVSVATFEVWLAQASRAKVIETMVKGENVFLQLEHELASDATPVVQIAEGEEVEDRAGNSTNRRKLGAVRIKDGIAPRLTVTLSGGSGRGSGDEGPNRLTNDTIDIRVMSDEPLQSAPRVIVVCESLSWIEMDSGKEIERDIDDFFANRNGPFTRRPQEPPDTAYTCGYDEDGDGADDPFELTEDIAHSRPGEVWEYTWRNPAGVTRSLIDGELVVVAYGRDRSRYERFGETVSNWATAKGDFGFDTRFGSEAFLEQVKIHPPDGSVIREPRPFVLLEFPEATSVNLASVVFDGKEIVDAFEVVRDNEFVYWPLSMNQGNHSVEVEANDYAGNESNFEFHFETTQRGDFILPLVAGWNAVSIPADPIDPTIENVFTHPAIEMVMSWDPYELQGPWVASIRDGDAWVPWQHGREITKIQAGSGYLVKSSRFIKQPIALTQERQRVTRDYDGGCGSFAGWFFVGVTDVDGDQTQNHFGEPLRDHDKGVLTVGEYLGKYIRHTYSWDPIEAKYRELSESDAVLIGEGIWYYGGGWASCP